MSVHTPESRVKREVTAYLRGIGAYVFMPVQMGYGQKTLDYLCCVNGRFVAVETKAPGKYPTKFQEITAQEIVRAGGVAISPAWHEQHVVDALRQKGVIQ